MRFISNLADRLLEKVAPAVTADAACQYLSTEEYFLGDPSCPHNLRAVTVIHYDNCPPKKTSRCYA
ncbi:hypothetical protein AB0J80_27780 [Actinoplanes sp. NPDC049548]|uniref:hypothetical protein n=1 Tax=Actinoplanes sp. NPDC049548 TaxID=3155152 RepID=UPI00341E6DD2